MAKDKTDKILEYAAVIGAYAAMASFGTVLFAAASGNIIVIITAVITVILAIVSSAVYITYDLKKADDKTSSSLFPAIAEKEFEYLDNQIKEIKQNLLEKKPEYTAEEKQHLLEMVANKIQEETAQTYFAALKQELFNQTKQEEHNYLFDKLIFRLSGQIDLLKYRNRYNLVIGIIIAFIGVIFLGLSILWLSSEQNSEAFTNQFLPKVTLTILTEIFAFFFLKLYSNGLIEIKYWHNEITNLELKRIAYNSAMKDLSLNELQTKMIEGFAATERNFVLNKHQTTIELEKEKITQQNIADLLDALKKQP